MVACSPLVLFVFLVFWVLLVLVLFSLLLLLCCFSVFHFLSEVPVLPHLLLLLFSFLLSLSSLFLLLLFPLENVQSPLLPLFPLSSSLCSSLWKRLQHFLFSCFLSGVVRRSSTCHHRHHHPKPQHPPPFLLPSSVFSLFLFVCSSSLQSSLSFSFLPRCCPRHPSLHPHNHHHHPPPLCCCAPFSALLSLPVSVVALFVQVQMQKLRPRRRCRDKSPPRGSTHAWGSALVLAVPRAHQRAARAVPRDAVRRAPCRATRAWFPRPR